jgi:hypothetical protein
MWYRLRRQVRQLLIQRIEIDDQRLFAQFIVPGALPRLASYATQLRDIEAVIIGPISRLKYFAGMPEFEAIKKLIAAYEELHVRGRDITTLGCPVHPVDCCCCQGEIKNQVLRHHNQALQQGWRKTIVP